MMTQRLYRADFRKEDCTLLFRNIRRSASASIVGVGSIGKSNLIAHIVNPMTQIHYLGDEAASALKLITLDANMLVPLTSDAVDDDAKRCWSGYELMMHRLFTSFYPFNDLQLDEVTQFTQLYQALQDGRNPLYPSMGLRYLELALDLLMRRGFHVAFLFDEFEQLLKRLPVAFFLTLRGLRDNHKASLSYITFSRAPLPVLIERDGISAIEIEPFVELFNDGVRYVGPYNSTDAQEMLNTLAGNTERPPSPALQKALLHASGRFAGLIRAGWRILDSLPKTVPTPEPDTLTDFLVQRKPIQLECQSLWDSLTEAEQMVLEAVARQQNFKMAAIKEDAVAMLVQKRLLHVSEAGNALIIQPPLLHAYLLLA